VWSQEDQVRPDPELARVGLDPGSDAAHRPRAHDRPALVDWLRAMPVDGGARVWVDRRARQPPDVWLRGQLVPGKSTEREWRRLPSWRSGARQRTHRIPAERHRFDEWERLERERGQP